MVHVYTPYLRLGANCTQLPNIKDDVLGTIPPTRIGNGRISEYVTALEKEKAILSISLSTYQRLTLT
jgi:hypothetical protein